MLQPMEPRRDEPRGAFVARVQQQLSHLLGSPPPALTIQHKRRLAQAPAAAAAAAVMVGGPATAFKQ